MRNLLVTLACAFSFLPLAHAQVASTLNCGGINYPVRFNIAGRPGYVVINGERYFLTGDDRGTASAVPLTDRGDYYDYNKERAIQCSVSSYRTNP